MCKYVVQNTDVCIGQLLLDGYSKWTLSLPVTKFYVILDFSVAYSQ